MKVVFIGAGSHRYLSVARSILAVDGLMSGGELNLYDPAAQRAEAVGRMILKTPEARDAGCRVRWGDPLDVALEGANAVLVVLMAGSRTNHGRCESVCRRHGFVGSDQLSPSGAMLALKGGPILMDLAARMEKYCPDAWLVDFANPVAVLSAAVNNHTRIQCLGVCGGYQNHQWDLTRLLYGRDEQWTDYKIRCAGVNHLSFVLPGSRHRERDIYDLARERIDSGWRMPELSDRWNEGGKRNIVNSVTRLADYYRKYGKLVFSSEGDGLDHLDIEHRYLKDGSLEPERSEEEWAQDAAGGAAWRAAADRHFLRWLEVEMDDATWNTPRPDALELLRADEDIMVKVVKAIGGEATEIATSFPNRGAVRGFKDRTVLEYSQILKGGELRPANDLEVPDVFQGLISSLATHQTLLGDAIATEDPRVLFEALYSYPVLQDTAVSKALWRDLLETARDEIPASFAAARPYFDN